MSNSNKTTAPIKDLSFIALFSLIFGSMMGSGVFDIPENISHSAGVIAVSIGWIITTIGIIALSWAFIYITNKRPDIKSGIYGYAKYGFGDYVGFNSAWGYALNSILANVSYLIYICATLGNFAFFSYFGKGGTINALVIESVLIWVVYFLIRRGIREASLVNVFISTIKILALITIILLFINSFHWQQFIRNIHFEFNLGSTFEQIKSTMLVTVWDFTGIEAACIFALRAKNMQDVTKATLLGAIVVILIDVAISILPFGIMPSSAIRNLTTPSTAGVLATTYGTISAQLIRIAVVISVSGALLAWSMLATNMFYLTATDKTMPKYFTYTNKKGVPINALLISSLLTQLFVILAFFTNTLYLAMIQLATSLILLPYLLSTLFAVKLIIAEGKTDALSLLKGVLAVLYSIWLVYSGGLKFLALSSALYILGALFYISAKKEQQQKIFASKYESSLFIILFLISIISFIVWSKTTLS